MLEILLIIVALFVIGVMIPRADVLPWQGDRVDLSVRDSRFF